MALCYILLHYFALLALLCITLHCLALLCIALPCFTLLWCIALKRRQNYTKPTRRDAASTARKPNAAYTARKPIAASHTNALCMLVNTLYFFTLLLLFASPCIALMLYILSYRFSRFELHTSFVHFYSLFFLLASYNCHALHCSALLLWKDALTKRCQHGAIQPARCGNRTKPTRHENQAQPTRLWI